MHKNERIVVVGAGRVGSALAKALKRGSCEIVAVISRSLKSAITLAEACGCPTASTCFEDIPEADVIIITTPDDTIEEVAVRLAESGVIKRGTLVLHTSGALSSEVLAPLKKFGAHLASLHPIQTFSGSETDVERLPGTYFGIEGDEDALLKVRELVETLEALPLLIPRGEKMAYHLGCVVASNYLVTLLAVTCELLKDLDLNEQQILKVLRPLVEGTFENVERLGVKEALTGPIARGDIGTIKNHLQLLRERFPHLVPFYIILGKEAIKLALAKGGIDEVKAAEIGRILEDYGESTGK